MLSDGGPAAAKGGQAFGHVLVTEHQDTNTIQHEVVRITGDTGTSLTVLDNGSEPLRPARCHPQRKAGLPFHHSPVGP